MDNSYKYEVNLMQAINQYLSFVIATLVLATLVGRQ